MRPRTRTWVPLAGLGLLAVGGFAVVPCIDFIHHRADRAATEQFVRTLSESAAARVPPGAGEFEVHQWCKRHNMCFTGIDPVTGNPGAEVHGIPPADFGGGVMGVAGQRLSSGHITHRVFFFFGKDGKVIKHQILTHMD